MLSSNFFSNTPVSVNLDYTYLICTPLSVNLDHIRISNIVHKKVHQKQTLFLASLAHTKKYPDINNRPSNFQFKPSIWKDRFCKYASINLEDSEEAEKHTQKSKVEIKRMLKNVLTKPAEKLELIDAIQRLGLSYHFKNEINEILQDNHTYFKNEDNLHLTALKFRLFREEGHDISCDVFDRFKNHEGKLKESYVRDSQGLLSLYEASHLRMHGEDFLEEALSFTSTLLKALTTREEPKFAARINNALKWPVGKAFQRLETIQNLSFYKANHCKKELF